MSNVGVWKFTAISGFFEHDDEPGGPDHRATTTHNLGLIGRGYSTDETFDPRNEKPQWERLINYLDHLNREGASKYKLFFLVRHGQGYHNVKEAQVGRAVWERDWARLDGDDVSTWFDAHLTEKGKQQAAAINTFLRTSAAQDGMPLPIRHYTSPLSRCLETTRLAFYQLEAASSREMQRTVVKECLREGLGVHTCDRRRRRSWIHETYPDYEIEDGFTEDDELWKPDIRESMDDHIVRIRKPLEDIFEDESESVVSLTAHSGAIRALYAVIGHKEIYLGPGVIVPVLIKADLAK